MKAGIDCGTSHMKAVWRQADDLHAFASSSDGDDIVACLARHGIMQARLTGIGPAPALGRIAAVRCAADPIEDEIALQADGARRLLAGTPGTPEGDFLLVSVGTGTSYTLVPKDGPPRRFPIGNAIGGGFIAGLAAMQALEIDRIDDLARRGTALDLLVKDLVPAAAGTLQGEFVVSHFGKLGIPRFTPEAPADGADPLGDICTTIVHCAAVAIIRDVLILGMIPGFAADDAVFIGTPVAKMVALRGHFARYAAGLGKRAHFPENGEYAAALGALYADTP